MYKCIKVEINEKLTYLGIFYSKQVFQFLTALSNIFLLIYTTYFSAII